MKEEPLQVVKAEVEADDDEMVVKLRLRNDSDSTLHIIAGLRQLLYDPATRELTVRLTDSGLAELPMQPPYEAPPPLSAVDPHDEREITVKLPRFVTRIEPGPTVVQVPAHEATSVTVEIGWSDRPFYRDPRGKGGSIRSQLQKWERGVAPFRSREVRRKRQSRPPTGE
jgi:hypothetical protein